MTKKTLSIQKEDLERLYTEYVMSIRSIAKYYKVSEGFINKQIKKYNLKQNLTKTGMIYRSIHINKYNDYINKVYCNLTLLSYNINNDRWTCSCNCSKDCGIIEISTYKIMALKYPCCSKKYSNTSGKNSYAWKGEGELSSSRFHILKSRAKQRNLEFNLTKKYLWNLFLKQDKKCALTNIDLVLNDKGELYGSDLSNTASVDRIDSNKGYIKGNVQWVHKTINIMKWDITEDKFIEYCKLVNKNFKRRI